MGSTKFQYTGKKVKVINDGTIEDILYPAIYRVGFCKFEGFFLEKELDRFKIPKKVYGKSDNRAKKILRTFDDRDRNTGVLLTGDKGSGKTMLAEVVCNTLLEKENMPVVMITERFVGSNFISFINSLGIITLFFDEFGKVYPKSNDYEADHDTQEALLSLMDGGGRQKRLILMTENRDGDINEYMRSRPGRIYYHFKYGKLEEDTIKEYINEQDLEPEISEYIIDASRKMETFSFDILQAIIEEYKRYGGEVEDLEESMADLNIDYDKDSTVRLEVVKLIKKKDEVTEDGSEGKDEEIPVSYMSKYIDKPTYDHEQIWFKSYDSAKHEENTNWRKHCTHFHGSQLKYDAKDKLVYENKNYILVTRLSRIPKFSYNYSSVVKD